jgi:DNA-binding NarL/FixJ family response regulator
VVGDKRLIVASSPAETDPHPLVLLVEDEVLVRMTLARMLESGGFRVVSAASANEALEVLGAGLDIRALVTDVELSPGGMNGFELARTVHQEYQISAVVMSGGVSPRADDLPAGAYFLAKPVHKATLIQLVWSVVEPQAALPADLTDVDQTSSGLLVDVKASQTLTPRQHEVLGLLVQGRSNREIAEVLGLSENTVKVHLAVVFRVLGVHSRTEALLAGLKRLPPR